MKKGLVLGTPKTDPPTPQKGGSKGGYFLALFEHEKNAKKSALFCGSVFDHNFGLVFRVFSNPVRPPKMHSELHVGNYWPTAGRFYPPH